MSAPNEQLRERYATDGVDICAFFVCATMALALSSFSRCALVAFSFAFVNIVNMRWNAKRITNWAGFLLVLLVLPIVVIWIGNQL